MGYKVNIKSLFETFISISLVLCSILSILFLKNSVSTLKIIGILIILTSIFMIFKYRKINSISLMIGIIALISISFAYSVCFNTYETAFYWQVSLVETDSNIINAKNFLLFITVLIFSIGEIKKNDEKNFKEIINFEYNPFIVFGCIIFLIYALIFGFDRGIVGTYTSNTNAIYEYALIIFLFAWQYAKNNKILKKFLWIYAILYCLQGLMYGDRSSCFPMILLLLIFFGKNRIKMRHVIIIGICGIFFANIIDIFRNTGDIFNFATLREVFKRGLFVNTISYSFYGGTQMIRYGLTVSFHDRIIHLFNYILSIFFGKSNKYSLTVISNLAGYINKGGGMSQNYFYFWGGFIGTFIFAFLIGKIIKYVFTHDTRMSNIFKITLTIFTIRWFVYYPTAFFRTALFIPFICYYVFQLFNKMLKKK